jgi:hypothetical protein
MTILAVVRTSASPLIAPPVAPPPPVEGAPRRSVFRRDELLDARFSRYVGGIKLVDGLDAPRVRALLSEGYLAPTTCANPTAPSAIAFALFLERWSPAARASGYGHRHRTTDAAEGQDSQSR